MFITAGCFMFLYLEIFSKPLLHGLEVNETEIQAASYMDSIG